MASTASVALDPPARSPVAVDNARHLLDEQTRALADSMRSIAEKRNRLAPISMLPLEVFVQTLAVHVHDTLSLYPAPAAKALLLSHVCRRWRTAVQSAPVLWDHISPLSPWLAARALELAGTVELRVSCRFEPGAKRYAAAILSALQHGARLRDVCLRAERATMCRFTGELLRPAPLLQSLSLAVDTSQHLPPGMFAGLAPQLRDVRLRGCVGHWDAPMFRGLTVLEVCELRGSTALSVDQFRALLATSPRLRSISFQHSIRVTNDDLVTTDCNAVLPAALPFLREATIHARTGTHLAILAGCFTISCDMVLDLVAREALTYRDFDIFRTVYAVFDPMSPDAPAMERLGVVKGEDTLSISFQQRSESSRPDLRIDRNFAFHSGLTLVQPAKTASCLRTLEFFFSQLRVERISALSVDCHSAPIWHVSSYEVLHDAEWLAIMKHLHRLERIDVTHGGFETVARVLGAFDASSGIISAEELAALPHRVPFPLLKRVGIFCALVPVGDGALLAVGLRRRAERGLRLRRLELSGACLNALLGSECGGLLGGLAAVAVVKRDGHADEVLEFESS